MKIITFGEVLMRLSPPNNRRFTMAHSMDVTFTGAEANVAVSLANFGWTAEHVTRLPDNDFGEIVVRNLRNENVGTKYVLRGKERMGVFYLEQGAAQRSSRVIYDRSDSAMAKISSGSINWARVLADADWFHWSGITPAISQSAANVCMEGILKAKELGVKISADINFRSSLWNYGKAAGEVLAPMLANCDFLNCGIVDAQEHFGIATGQVLDFDNGDQVQEIYQLLIEKFPKVRTVISTYRNVISTSHHQLKGLLFEDGKLVESSLYEVTPIIDRVGGGDAYTAAAIFAMCQNSNRQATVDFATAATVLKHSIPGDYNRVSIREVMDLAKNGTGRVKR